MCQRENTVLNLFRKPTTSKYYGNLSVCFIAHFTLICELQQNLAPTLIPVNTNFSHFSYICSVIFLVLNTFKPVRY